MTNPHRTSTSTPLSPHQERLLGELCAQWAERAARPDRARAESAVAALYRAAGAEPPHSFLWLDSPLAGALAAGALLAGGAALRDEVRSVWQAAAQVLGEGDNWPEQRRTRGPVYDGHLWDDYHYAGREDLFDPVMSRTAELLPASAWPSAWVRDQVPAQANHPADPVLLAGIRAAAEAGLARAVRPVLPSGAEQAAQGAMARFGPDSGLVGPMWSAQWQEVLGAMRRPYDPHLLIPAAFLSSEAGRTDPAPLEVLLRLGPSVGWWWALDGVAVLTPPPAECHTGPGGVLHRSDGPAVRFADGFGIHVWHGHLVPGDLIDPGWSAADIAEASDADLARRRADRLGPQRFSLDLTDLRRCALERLGWGRFAVEAGLTRVADPVPDPGEPGCALSLYDVPEAVFGRPGRVVVRAGGCRDGEGLLVPTDLTDAVAGAAWLGTPGAPPASEPELLARIRAEEDLQDLLAGMEFELDRDDPVEEVRLLGGARLEPIAGHGTGGCYFLCGDGPRRPVLYADSEGGAQVLGRDIVVALEFMVSADPDDGEPEEAEEEAAEALGLTPLTAEQYRVRRQDNECLAVALTLLNAEEGNAYEYRNCWFR